MSLAAWQREIEQTGGGRLIVVRVETDRTENTLRIPADFPGRALVRRFLLDENFVGQLVRAHSLSINTAGEEGRFHFILLNMALALDWEGLEDSLLAHEFGHIWLHVHGYRSPSQSGGNCLATSAGDIVQHVLIRDETARRGLPGGAYLLRNLESWLREMERPSPGAALDACRRLQVISMWLDAALGTDDRQWPLRARFMAGFAENYSTLAATAEKLAAFLGGLDLRDRSHYEAALNFTLETLADVVNETPGARL
jgi:hypothetical protein